MTVIILGSGISGVAAAAELTKKGIKVLMLEAQDRIGGRIWTIDSSGGHKYDKGASWMHETLINPLFKVAAQNNLELYYDDGPTAVFTKNGPIDASDKIDASAKDLLNNIKLDYHMGKFRRSDVSLQQYATEFVNNWPLITEAQKRLTPRYIQYMELWAAVPWTEIPASTADIDHLGRDAYVVHGYKQVYDWVYEQIDLANFKLIKEAPATRITGSGQGYDITAAGKTYSATDVICTIPLGALKDVKFEMSLPKPLLRSIEEGLMASLGKFFVEFPEVFWNDSFDRFLYLIDEDPEVELPFEPGNFTLSATNIYRNYPGNRVLVFLTARPLTDYLEANPTKVFEHIKPMLELMAVEGKQVPEPIRIYSTDWSGNPYFKGSYAAYRVGVSMEDEITPFVEGAGRLRFAGEHTAFEGTGCVHGAYMSGLREASNILDNL